MIFGQGVRTDPKKIEAMLQWPVPTSVKALKGFLGFDRSPQEVCEGL